MLLFCPIYKNTCTLMELLKAIALYMFKKSKAQGAHVGFNTATRCLCAFVSPQLILSKHCDIESILWRKYLTSINIVLLDNYYFF